MLDNDYFKEQYYYELSRRDRLHRDLSLPIAILIAIGAANMNLLSSFYGPLDAIDCGVLVLITTTFISLAYCVFCLSSAGTNNAYSYSAKSQKLDNYRNELSLKQGASPENAKIQFSKFIEDEYIRCATENATINDTRSENIDAARRSLLIASMTLFVGALPFTIHETFFKRDNLMMTTELTVVDNEEKEPAPNPSPSEKPEPTPPPGRQVRDAPETIPRY